jgi:hypothetical protein
MPVPNDPGDGEVVHLIVHDDAGRWRHELAAPDQVDAGRYYACVNKVKIPISLVTIFFK